ncbi:MAG TPA: DMT family transporter [Stellaceae bacterium]|nr:DMT family transporter [Stellaceae bacterium]
MPSDSTPQRLPDALRGILLMCLGVTMFPFLNTCAKLLSTEYPLLEIVWARFTGHFVVMALIFLPGRGWRLFAAHRLSIQIVRSVLLLGSTLFFIRAIGTVPLATASTIGFTTPLMVTALSVPMLHEAVGPRRWAAVGVGFIGALIVIRPGSGFTDPAVLLLIGSATCYALYQIATRRGAFHDNAETGIVYAALIGTIVMSALVPFDFVPPRKPTDYLLFAALGIFGGFGHYFVTQAFRLGPAALISPLGYVELIGTTVMGYLVFGNFPDFWTWVGATLIVASGIYIAFRERRRRKV